MNTISHTQGVSSNIYSIDSSASTPSRALSLTPQALLLFCTSRLKNLDSQIQEFLTKQNANIQSTEALGDMQRLLGPMMSKETMNGKDVCDAICAMDKKLATMPEGAGKQKLQEIRDTLWKSGSDEGRKAFYEGWTKTEKHYVPGSLGLSQYEVKKTIQFLPDGNDIQTEMLRDSFRSANSSLRNDAEMGMLQVQTLMSERQTALQLTTNLLNSLGEQLKLIAQNVGR